MANLPGASNVVASSGLLTTLAGAAIGFVSFFGALVKLLLVAAALGTGFGVPIVVMAWWLNRKKS